MSFVAVAIVGGAVAVGSGAVNAIKTGKANKAAKKDNAIKQDVLENQISDFDRFEFKDPYAGIGDKIQNVEAQQATAQGYTAQQATASKLGKAQGYSAQGYEAERADAAQLGPAGQVSLRNLAGGADFLSNPFANLQTGTAASDLQGAQTDAALAATLESGNVTGAGGATALAQAAAQSKQGIAANIQQQELNNAQLRAQGQQSLEQASLSQSNLQNQFGFEQDRYNVDQSNQFKSQQAQLTQQANLQNAQAANQASQFTAGAQNEAARFGAQANNQFAQAQFSADNQFALANQAASNQAAQFGASAQNQLSQFNTSAANQANQINVGAANQAVYQEAAGASALQDSQYGQETDILNIRAGQAAGSAQAKQAAAANSAAAWSGLGQAGASAAGAAIGNPNFGG